MAVRLSLPIYQTGTTHPLNKKTYELIARIQHSRNLAAPIHQLPQVIFQQILEFFTAGRPVDDEYGLLQLVRVGRLWYGTIVNSPQLWTWLDSALPPKIARLVIQRSSGLHKLSCGWNTANEFEGYEEEYGEILELAEAGTTVEEFDSDFRSHHFNLLTLPLQPVQNKHKMTFISSYM
ncbi:hypothetical protein FRC05_006563 [Tulasnella sp. 425]|nr:hypothetical protein FRC05_006563 [Tulasnella sp. 425]